MSSPRLAPWLIPETISSGSKPIRPERREAHAVHRRAVGRVADVPSSNSISSTHSGARVVMLRALAERLAVRRDHGQLDARAAPAARGASRSARCAWMPSSFVRRTFTPIRL